MQYQYQKPNLWMVKIDFDSINSRAQLTEFGRQKLKHERMTFDIVYFDYQQDVRANREKTCSRAFGEMKVTFWLSNA